MSNDDTKQILDEVRSLKAKVTGLADGQASLTDGQASLTEKVEGLADGQASLADGQASLTEKVEGLTTQMGGISTEVGSLKDEVGGIAAGQASLTSEVRIMSGSLTSLTRVVDRIDQRLVDVEQHVVSMKHGTDLIPDISEAVAKQFIYLDGHEKRLKRLEKVRA